MKDETFFTIAPRAPINEFLLAIRRALVVIHEQLGIDPPAVVIFDGQVIAIALDLFQRVSQRSQPMRIRVRTDGRHLALEQVADPHLAPQPN